MYTPRRCITYYMSKCIGINCGMLVILFRTTRSRLILIKRRILISIAARDTTHDVIGYKNIVSRNNYASFLWSSSRRIQEYNTQCTVVLLGRSNTIRIIVLPTYPLVECASVCACALASAGLDCTSS